MAKLTSYEVETVRNFAQKELQNYLMSNNAVYQQAVEALCNQKIYSFEEHADLEFSRYGTVTKEWREFRYKLCRRLFNNEKKIVKEIKPAYKFKTQLRAFG